MTMHWTSDHDRLLVREVLAVNPHQEPKGSTERSKLWEEIAINLNAIPKPKFSVTLRSVRDHMNLVLIKKYKKKIADEEKASGIDVDDPSELDVALEEICEKAESSDRDQQTLSEGRREKIEKEKKEAEDMRTKAMEKVGETNARKRVECDDSDQADIKPKRGRRTGGETIAYLKEKSEKELEIRHEELQLKKQHLAVQESQQKDLTQQLITQQEQQQTAFATFQQQQQQQLQQLSQMQMGLMQQQQQQSQALMQVLQEFAKKH